MSDDQDSLYRREKDREWRDRTEERIVNLQNGDATQNDRLQEHDEHFQQLDILLEGQPEDKNDNGLKGDVHDLSVGLNELRRLMQPDNLGHGGIISRIKALEAREEQATKSAEYRWKFWLALLGFISAATVAVISNLEKIERLWNARDKDPLHVMMDHAKNPKPKRRHYRVIEPPDPEEQKD